MLKYIILLTSLILFFGSCSSLHKPQYQSTTLSKIVLNKANFKMLGSFSGIASMKRKGLNLKAKEGLISLAKKDFFEASEAGEVDFENSCVLINISIEFIENKKNITCTFSAEIIQFIK